MKYIKSSHERGDKMTLKKIITHPSVWVIFLFTLFFSLSSTSVYAEVSNAVNYRDMSSLSSRNLVWVLSQVHILFGAFLLGVPMFIIVIEIMGVKTGEARYDKLALEFTDLIVAVFATTALSGIFFLFSLLVFYPELMRVMAGIFSPTYYVYLFLFLAETACIYIYWSKWEAWQNRKALHIFWGMMLNIAGLALVFLPNGFLAFQASPVVLSPDLTPWAKAWTAINNPTWLPVVIHRVVGNLILGGFVCGAYAGVAYLGAKTQEEKELREGGAPWWETGPALDYWKFLKDLEEGRIRRLNGRKIG